MRLILDYQEGEWVTWIDSSERIQVHRSLLGALLDMVHRAYFSRKRGEEEVYLGLTDNVPLYIRRLLCKSEKFREISYEKLTALAAVLLVE